MKNICIISHTNPQKDPRALKQVNYFSSLSAQFKLFYVGNHSKEDDRYVGFDYKQPRIIEKIIKIIFYLKTKNYEKYFWSRSNVSLANELLKIDFDLVIVHGIRNILLGLKIAKKAKILFDAHEYYPDNFSDNFFWRITIRNYYKYLCEKYLSKVDHIITVSPGIVELYKKNFNVQNIDLITNATYFRHLKPTPIDENHIKIIHHGNCSSSRRLELMIEAAKYFNENFHLYLMLVVSRGYENYFRKLKRVAKNLKNVHFITPVSGALQIVDKINFFDISLIFVPNTNFNLNFGLGNKFFESIQARLMLITGPSIEMIKYIDEYQLGKYTKSFEPQELASLINNLSVEEIKNYKDNVDKNAMLLSDEVQNLPKFKEIVQKLL